MLFFSLLWRNDWCCFSLFFVGMTGAVFSLLWRNDWCCFSLFFGGMTGAFFLSSLEG